MPDMNPAPADPAELAPPPEPSLLTALPWAIGAHVALLLVFALLSMSWRRSEEQSEAIEAEIWAASVQQAAPRAVRTAPQPRLQPAPEPRPKPQPAPEPKPRPPAPQPDAREADIAREQKEKEQQRQRQLEQQRQEKLRLEKERAEKERQDKLREEKERQEKERQEKEKQQKERAEKEKERQKEKERLEKQLQQEKEKLDRERRAEERRQAEADKKAAIPAGLRNLFLYPVANFDVAQFDNLTVTENGGVVTVRFVHRGTAYELTTDKKGNFDVLTAAKIARNVGDNNKNVFTVKPEYLKAGGDAAKMSDVDWSKVQLVSDTFSPESAYHYEGTLKFTFKNNILIITGTLKRSK